MDTKQFRTNRPTPGVGRKHRTRRGRQPDVRVLCWICLKDLTEREKIFARSAHLPPVCAEHWYDGERARDDDLMCSKATNALSEAPRQ